MAITRKDVEHVAGLARLRPTEEEVDLYTGQLQRILSHVEKIDEIDTTGVEPTTSTVPLTVRMREDVATPSLSHDDALLNAPEKERGAFKVPKIIE